MLQPTGLPGKRSVVSRLQSWRMGTGSQGGPGAPWKGRRTTGRGTTGKAKRASARQARAGPPASRALQSSCHSSSRQLRSLC